MPIAKGLSGPGLLAHLIVSKYTDHMPLHRLQHASERQGYFLHRSTLCDWLGACADLLRPLYDLMVSVVLQSRALHTDDTTVKMQELGTHSLTFGIPRTTDESFWPNDPAAKAAGVKLTHMMEGRKGEKSRELAVYDLEQRRLIDAEITRRTIDFMKRSVRSGKPFYAYVPFTLVHFPTRPNPKFAGKTGYGDFPDALSEMDAHVGEILDSIDELRIRDNTLVVFTSDNGPEATWPWQGSSGPWRGYYFTHMEGSLRVPFIIRWPGRVPAGRVSNEIVHEVDTYTTFAKIAGAQMPQDRPIDGVDQTDLLLGKSDKSSREGFPVFVADRLEAVKWRNWKVVFYEEQRDWGTVPAKLGVPKVFDLITDPKEEYPATRLRHSWSAGPAMKIVAEFEQSLKKYPPIPTGTPDPYTPKAGN